MSTFPAAANSQIKSFGWAEPLICEQVLQTYSSPEKHRSALDRIVSVHTKMWLCLIDGNMTEFDAKRGDLARLADEADVPAAAIDRADRAVLLELILVVVTRFRNSDRLRLAYVERLNHALRVIKAAGPPTLH